MDIVLKNIKLVRGSYPEKGEPDLRIIRNPTKEEKSIILNQIAQFFDNIFDAIGDEDLEYIMDKEKFLEICDPLFFDETEELFWTITFDSIESE
jgi:hypothetical protein